MYIHIIWSVTAMVFQKVYVLLMDGVYTVCEDWGEGSGLEVWETECNEADPGEINNR